MNQTGVFCAFVLACHFVIACAPAIAQPLPYWQHSEWTGENAPPLNGGAYLGRSADGYLWIGGQNSIIRFDGIRFKVLDSTNTPAFRGVSGGSYNPALTDRDGVLWINGPRGSVFTYADGVVTTIFPEESDADGQFVEDGAGRLWINSFKGLWLIKDKKLVRPQLPPGLPDSRIYGIERDNADGLWIGTETQGLWHVRGNQVEHFGSGSLRVLLHSKDGIVWVIGDGLGQRADLWQLVDGKFTEVHPPGDPTGGIASRIAHESSDGSSWFVTSNSGLLRWHNGQMERFTKSDGLSNSSVRDVLIDDEGVVWATTESGLDRLRTSMFASIEQRNGSTHDHVGLFAEDASGAMWSATPQSAYLLDSGIIRNRAGSVTSKMVLDLATTSFQLAAPSVSGGIWLGPSTGGIMRLTTSGDIDTRLTADVPKSQVSVAVELQDGSVWTRSLAGDVGRSYGGKYKPFPVTAANRPTARGMAADGLGRAWFVSSQRRVTVLRGDSVVSQFELPKLSGDVMSLGAEGGDTMWVSTNASLVRIVGERATEVVVRGLQGLLQTPANLVASNGFLWLASTGGIGRVLLADLHRAADSPTEVTSYEIFGPLDGLRDARIPSHTPIAMRRGRDGRVWVVTPNGLAVADPAFRMTTKYPRKIIIEEFSVGDSALEVRNGVRVPPSPSRVSVRFTVATTLLAERVRIQYRLDGADDKWIDASLPRIATYNLLPAGSYVFHVRAWDEAGQPLPEEATFAFRVMPTWYQSWWFAVLVGVTGAAIILVLYRLRVRELRQAYNVRLEERWAERTRIARELHDTLLQNFQGLMFRLQAVREMLPAQSEKAIPILDTALIKGEEAIDRARIAVSDLRSPEKIERDFDAGLTAIAAEAVHLCKHEPVPSWSVDTKGRVRDISQVVLYELYQITQEAIGNAFQHSRASHVQVDVRYGFDDLRVTVTDDGDGFDDKVMALVLRPGHFGLQGMMERIEKLGGRATLSSKPGEGTSATLTVPAAVAYRKSPKTGNGSASRNQRPRSRSEHHE
jgi:signal transduction histidine kinase/ligand-binding sensor domain-containing protein